MGTAFPSADRQPDRLIAAAPSPADILSGIVFKATASIDAATQRHARHAPRPKRLISRVGFKVAPAGCN